MQFLLQFAVLGTGRDSLDTELFRNLALVNFTPSARNKSSQCATIVMPSFGAFFIASLKYFVFSTGLPSSVSAIAPALFTASMSVGSSF